MNIFQAAELGTRKVIVISTIDRGIRTHTEILGNVDGRMVIKS